MDENKLIAEFISLQTLLLKFEEGKTEFNEGKTELINCIVLIRMLNDSIDKLLYSRGGIMTDEMQKEIEVAGLGQILEISKRME